ncbi:hypothetical protein BP6252_01015 [Coleophoma cylindrospora]|uniref:Uncharacterized protein n=1 Tax=Coleophoma cylindrospora TaxID=1849047 RepID=A0A3D8SRP7_9HELO|nr:hypothetical protein BP6252_01015 [Coleophoma cylindrospora]
MGNAASWFPVGKNDSPGWRLDIVSLLAVIGESSMEEHAQTLTASWTCILPRIIPAPQALLKPSRPARMPQFPATVVGVYNGTKVETLNYFPHIIHPLDDLPPYSMLVYNIRHKNQKGEEAAKPAIVPPGTKSQDMESGFIVNGQESDDVHLQKWTNRSKRTSSFFERVKGTTEVPKDRAIPSAPKTKTKPHVPAATLSPLNIIAVLSCAMTIGLVIWAAFEQDGTAILALCTISLVSSIVGLASWWQPALMTRTAKSQVPRADIVIRTREGSFIVIKTTELVARELYTGTDECDYFIKNRNIYRALVGLGTFLLMVSVVLLGNCNWTMQAAIGSSYIILNGLYWLTSLFEKKYFWNMHSYEYDEKNQEPKYAHAHEETYGDPSYTRTLWYAIHETKETGWVNRAGAAPLTDGWVKWLKEAQDNVNGPLDAWDAVARKDALVGISDPEEMHVSKATATDTAKIVGNTAPSVPIDPVSRK